MSPHIGRLQPPSGVEGVLEKTVKIKSQYNHICNPIVGVPQTRLISDFI